MTGPRLRTRLTLLNAALAFGCSVLLLASVDLPFLVARHTTPGPAGGPTGPSDATNLPVLLGWSVIALAGLGVVSLWLGRLSADRALRPLRVLTDAARTMSLDTLAERPRVPAAYREFADLARTLDGLLDRLHQSSTAQRNFAAGASHELRTPLTVQRTMLQLALADPDATAESLRGTCQDLLDLGRQQEHLIDALLTLATGQQTIECWEPFDLAEVTRAVLRDQPGTEAGGVEVRTALAPAPVRGDPRLAGRLVANLVQNALRHNVPGGSVEVATSPGGRLSVGNTGAPIPPGDVQRLFQPFQRTGGDRTGRSEGHGLGLAIVAAVADAHRAPLAARPRPGGGLDVTVDFPVQE